MDGDESIAGDKNFMYISGYIVDHRVELLKYANSLTHHSHDDAQDLFQETVYRSLHSAGIYSERGTMGAWLRRIMHNIFINEVSRAAHHPTTEPDTLEVKDETLQPDERFSIGELYAAIEKLSTRDKEIVTMRLQGYSYTEIADCMNMKEGTVKSALHRIKIQLKQLLE